MRWSGSSKGGIAAVLSAGHQLGSYRTPLIAAAVVIAVALVASPVRPQLFGPMYRPVNAFWGLILVYVIVAVKFHSYTIPLAFVIPGAIIAVLANL